VPQIQVAFDIDANGILQVSALDRMTGREQSIIIQGASTLSEEEVNRMIRDAEEFAQTDRERRERVEKRNRIEGLILSAERQLREATLDYGIQFVSPYRQRIEALVRELRESLQRNDERGMDLAQSDLQDAIYELNREVYQRSRDEADEDDFFGSVRRAFSGDEPERSRRRNTYDNYELQRGGAPKGEYYGSSWNDEPGSYSSADRSYEDRLYGDRSYERSSYGDRSVGSRPVSDARGSQRSPRQGRGRSGVNDSVRYNNPYQDEDWGDEDENWL
jgi:molecular chaperone DnaK